MVVPRSVGGLSVAHRINTIDLISRPSQEAHNCVCPMHIPSSLWLDRFVGNVCNTPKVSAHRNRLDNATDLIIAIFMIYYPCLLPLALEILLKTVSPTLDQPDPADWKCPWISTYINYNLYPMLLRRMLLLQAKDTPSAGWEMIMHPTKTYVFHHSKLFY